MSHTSGVSGWDAPFTLEDVHDWPKSTSQLARQTPWWAPGTASGYHAINYGHLHRRDHPSDHRKTVPPTTGSAEAAHTVAWRRADIGAMNGHGNARSLARALSPICLGVAANGVQLLSPGTVDLNFQEQSNDIDRVLVTPLRLGVGLGLPEPRSFAFMPHEKICF